MSRFALSTRTVFIIAAVGFVLLLGLASYASGFRQMQGFPDYSRVVVFGGIFLFGSIGVLGRDLPLKILMWFAIILNAAGAIVWLPALFNSEALSFGVCGAALCCLWIKEILREAIWNHAR